MQDEDDLTAIEALRSALLNLRAAAVKVPINRHADAPPFLTCLGCGATDSNECKPGCWVSRLEAAVEDAEDALRTKPAPSGGE